MLGDGTLLRRIRDDRRTQALFARYVLIGGFVFCLDVGSFHVFDRSGLFRGFGQFAITLATATSYLLAVVTHFTLNRYLNFRNFDRTIVQQAGTYVVIAALCGAIQLAVVNAGVYWAGLPHDAAKVLAVALNVPIGFLGHRYLTFGHGILGAIRRIRA